MKLYNNARTFIAVSLLALILMSSRVSAQSNHTVTFTGNSTDFNAAELYAAAANNTSYYVTFDATNLYIGAFRTGGSTFGSTDNLAVYIDTDPNSTPTSGTGTTSGYGYNSVTGSLPFTANYTAHVEQSYQEQRTYSSGAWGSSTSPTVWTNTTAREIVIPWSTLGSPDGINLTMWMGYAGGMYSNVPGTNIAASGNPTIVSYFGTFCVKNGLVGNVVPTSVITAPYNASTTFSATTIPAGTYGDIYITGACTLAGAVTLIPGAVISVGNGTTTSSLSVGTATSYAINRTGIAVDTLSNELLVTNAGTMTFTPTTATAQQLYLGTISVQSGGTLTATTTTTGLAKMPLMCNNFIVANGGTYTHGMYGTSSSTNGLTSDFPGGGTGQTITLGASSNVTIAKWARTTGAAPAALPATSWGNLTINVPTFGGNWNQNGALNSVAGNLTITATGGYVMGLSSATNETANIGGNLAVNGANAQFALSLGAAVCTANVTGNVTLSNGTSYWSYGSGRTILNVTGNFSLATGTLYQAYSTGMSEMYVGGTSTMSSGYYYATGSTGPAMMSVTGLSTWSGATIEGQLGTNAQDTFNLTGGLTVSGSTVELNNAGATSYNTILNMNGTGATFTMSSGTFYAVYGYASATINMTSPTSSFSISGGTFTMNYANNNTATPTVNLAGSFAMTGGTLTWVNTTAAYQGGAINVAGNFSVTGGSIITSGAKPKYGCGQFVFNGTTQNIINTTTGTLTYTSFKINNGSTCTLTGNFATNSSASTIVDSMVVNTGGTLICGTNIVTDNGSAKGTFINNGTLVMGSPAGITSVGTASGNVQTGTARQFNPTSTCNYTYNGTSAQVTGTGLQTSLAGTLTINNSSGVTLTQSTTNTGTVSLASGLFSLGSSNLTNSGTISGYGSSTYIQTNGSGQLIQNVGGSATFYPVGNAAYDPFWMSNSGTAGTFGLICNNTIAPPMNDPSRAVTRSWTAYETTGGGVITPEAQWNSPAEEGSNFASSSPGTPYFGMYNGSSWVVNSASLSSPTMTATAAFTIPATATAYVFAVGKDNCFNGSAATVVLASNVISAGNIAQKTTNNVIGAFTLSASTNNATLTGMNFSTSGSYLATDLTNFKLWYQGTSSTFNAGTATLVSTISAPSIAGTQTFSSFSTSPVVTSGTTGYFFITTDLGCGTLGNTVAISALGTTNFSFSVTPTSFTGSASADGTQTIIGGTTNTYLWRGGASGSWAVSTNWSPNGVPGCGDAVEFDATYATETVTNVPTTTLASISTIGATIATLQPVSGGATVTLSNSGTALSIISGSTIILNPNNSTDILTLNYTGSGNTATIAGTLSLTSGSTGAATYNATNSATTISGTLNINDAVSVFTSTSTNVTVSGLVNMNNAATVIPVATWSSGATVTLAGLARVYSNLNQSFSNFTVNITGALTGSINLNGALTSVGGNLTITKVGSTARIFVLDSTTTETINIGGNISVAAGTLVLTNSTGVPTVNVTGGLTVTGGTLNMLTSTGNATMNVGGNFTQSGGTVRVSNGAGTGTLAVTGNYSQTAGTLYIAASSGPATMSVTGTTTSSGTTTDYIYVANSTGAGTLNMTGNLTISNASNYFYGSNGTTGTATINLAGNATLSAGYMYISNGSNSPTTGVGTFNVTGASSTFTISGGNVYLTDYYSNGYLNLSGSSSTLAISSGELGLSGQFYNAGGTSTVTCAGSFNMSGGTVDFSPGGYTNATLDVAGNFTVSGSTGLIWDQAANPSGYGNGASYNGTIIFNGAGTQTVTATGWTGNIENVNFIVSSGSVVTLASNFPMATSGAGATSSFTVNSGGTVNFGTYNINDGSSTYGQFVNNGTLIMGDPNGITTGTTALGNVQVTGGRTYSAGANANYTYNSSSAQVTGNGLPTTMAGTLTINDGSGVTLTQSTTDNGTLAFTSGVLALGTSNLTMGSASTISGYGASSYVQTNGSGKMIMTVGSSTTFYPVGNSAYDPFSMSNSGTSGTYGVICNNGITPAVNDPTLMVGRSWSVSQTTSGGVITPTAQWNSPAEEGSNFATGVTPYFGMYQGALPWVVHSASLSSPTMTATTAFTFPATGTAYVFAVGKDNCFNPSAANVVLGSNAISAGSLVQKTTNNVIGSFTFAVTTNNASLVAMNFTTTGSYLASDLTNFKLWYQGTSSTFNAGTATLVSTITSPAVAGTQTFPAFITSPTIASGTTGYFFVTADLLCGTIGNTVAISALSPSNFTFGVTPTTFTGSAAADGSQTIVGGTSTTYTWVGASGGSWTTSTNWSPAGIPSCGDAVQFGSGTVTVTGVPTTTLSSMSTISASAVVILQPVSGGATLTLSNSGTALGIISGSSITLNANTTSNLTLNYSGSGNTATIAGTLAVTSGSTGIATYNASNSSTTVSGTLNVNDAVSVITSSAANLNIASGGSVNLNNAATIIPVALWSSGSTVSLLGSATTFTNLGQSFYNVTFNSSTVGGNIELNGALTSVAGTLTVNAVDFYYVALTTTAAMTASIGNISVTGDQLVVTDGAATAPVVNVSGNVNISSAGSLYVSQYGGAATLNIAGNLTMSSSGSFSVTYESTAPATVNIGGNATFSSGTSYLANGASGITGTTTINLTGASSQFNVSGATLYLTYGYDNATINVTGASSSFNITSGQFNMSYANATTVLPTVNLAGSFSLTGGSFEWYNGATAGYLAGVVNVGGNFTVSGTSTITWSNKPKYPGVFNFNGTSPQNLSNTTTGVMRFTNFNILSGSTGILTSNFGVISSAITSYYDTLTVNAGGTLNCGTYNVNENGNTGNHGAFINNGTLIMGDPNGITLPGTALGNIQVNYLRTFNATSTCNYTYAGTASQVTGVALPLTLAGTLTINNSAGVKLTQSTTVNGTLNMIAGNFDLNGSNNVTLGPSATFTGESCSNLVVNSGSPSPGNGWIGTTRVLAANAGNVANLGLNLTTASALGSTTIKRFPKSITAINTTSNSINRIYSVTPASASTGTIAEAFTYCTSELNGNIDVTPPGLAAYVSTAANETVNAYSLAATTSDVNPTVVAAVPFSTGTTFVTFANVDKYCTVINGDWDNPLVWTGGAVPPANATICISNTITMNSADHNVASITLYTSGSLNIASTHTLTVNAGGSFTNSSGVAANLGSGTVNFAGAGTIGGASVMTFGNVTINSGALTIPSGSGLIPTFAGIFTINGGYVTSAPIYGAASTLYYNLAYSRYLEWSGGAGTIGTTPGYPNNVTVNTGTLNIYNSGNSTIPSMAGTLQINNGATATMNSLPGSYNLSAAALVINSGGTMNMSNSYSSINISGSVTNSGTLSLSSNSGGDIYVGGNWTKGGSATFNPNYRAVFFTGSGTEVLTVIGGGTETFNYLLVNGSGTLQLAPSSNAVVNQSSGLTLGSTNTTSTIDLNGQTLTVSGGGNLSLSSGVRYITSTIAGGKLLMTTAITTLSNLGTLVVNAGAILDLQIGFDGGGSGAINMNGTLEVDANGYMTNNGHAPTYGSGSTLNYNTGGSYTPQPGAEWYENTYTQPGVPYNVTITNGSTNLNFAGEGYPHEMWGNLTINSGTTLSLNSATPGADFKIKGNWNNAGTFNCGGREVIFEGSSAQILTGATTFDYFQITNSAGLTLNNNVTINSVAYLTSGLITTGSNNFIIASNANGAMSGYSSSSYVNGNLQRAVTASGSYDLPVGAGGNYQMANITFDAGLVSSTTKITAYFNPSTPTAPNPTVCVVNNSPIGSVLPAGYWTIVPDVEPNTGATYTASLYMTGVTSGMPVTHTNSEGVVVPAAGQIALIKRDAGVMSGAWLGCGLNGLTVQPYGVHVNSTQSVSGTSATAVRSGIPSFSDFSIGVEQSTSWSLPVTLIYFNAVKNEDNALLTWATASEINNDHFDIERSVDGVTFEKIGQVAGHDNSSVTVNYDYNDPNISSHQVSVLYYRLKQVDIDGNFTYSNIAAIDISNAAQPFHIISSYPNPFADHFSVSFYSPGSQPVRMTVYDVRGALVSEENITATEGMNVYTIPNASGLPAGFYTMNVSTADKNYGIKMLKGDR